MQWKFVTIPNNQLPAQLPTTVSQLANLGAKIYNATVPGNFVSDMISVGDLPDLFYSKNILRAREIENLHVFYYTEIYPQTDEYLHFDGIDTVADIYVNGVLTASCENMFLPVDVKTTWAKGVNSVVVHIKPVCIESRKYPLPASSVSAFYFQQGLSIRKPVHQFGWDILPRIVTAGINKPVSLRKHKSNSIDDVFVVTGSIDKQKNTARLRWYFQFSLKEDFNNDYSVKVVGKCGNSVFEYESVVWHTSHSFYTQVEDAKLWNPKNYGEPNLYDMQVTLYYRGDEVDRYSFSYGIRTAKLVKNDKEFQFYVNDAPIFVMGNNWVPTSVWHDSNHSRVEQAMALLVESGANMVRVWGGGAYEDDEFYNLCDQNGILVWQDFMMACGIYPQNEEFCKKLQVEAEYQIKRLRNHCSLVVWCGDNECDQAMQTWSDFERAPDSNVLTRKVLPNVLAIHDHTRDFIPSSPYIYSGHNEMDVVERHLWTRSEHFSSKFYLDTTAKFVSEIGYTAFPSVNSLQKFLKNPHEILLKDGTATDEYLLHGTAPDLVKNAWYDHKVPCACLFASLTFGTNPRNLDRFVNQSQYTQAEAYKTWIENARVKGLSGILLWNLLDAWPQVSEAMVDYYFERKPSFSFVKNAQRPVNVIVSQQTLGELNVFVVNDERQSVEVFYTIKCSGNVIRNGSVTVKPDEKVLATKIHTDGESNFYSITVTVDGYQYFNHYQENPHGLDIDKYMQNLRDTYCVNLGETVVINAKKVAN